MIITGVEKDPEVAAFKAKLLGSFLFFTEKFFKLHTGRDFVLSAPIGREPHQITIARQLVKIFNLETMRAWFTLPPGHGKSTFLTYFFAWCFAHYPDCKFIYISYSADLAATHTANIKRIMELPIYRKLFGIEISSESSAKDNFMTTAGGAVKAYGSMGGITGQDAGLPNLNRFSGGVFMDDMHKPSEVFSDTLRQTVIDNFNTTIKPRPRGPNVCTIGIGHALHEDDLRSFLINGRDGNKWEHLNLPAKDGAGNILAPNITTAEMLINEEKYNPYVYWSQYQGEPRPAGGGIFKPEWFVFLDQTPEMLVTFLTVDTAESTKDHADYSVFSFWGLYEIRYKGRNTGDYGLHWIDCMQERIEPAELESELLSFYTACLDFPKKPRFIAIEKKSTGTTLISILNKIRGFEIRDIERTKASRNKVARYFEAQPYVAKRLVSFPKYGRHVTLCLDHIRKITANGTHAHDDIADTLYDAVRIGLIEKLTLQQTINGQENTFMSDYMCKINKINRLRSKSCQR